MANLKMYNPTSGKKSTFKLDPKSYYDALKDPLELKELESLNLIKSHIESFTRCVVMTSHGKDSMVLCHLVKRASLDLNMEDKVEYWLNNTLNIYQEEKPFWDSFNKYLGIEESFKVFVPPKLPNGKQATVWSVADYFGHLPTFRHTAETGKAYKHGNTPECCDWLKKKSIKDYLRELPEDERVDCQFIGTRGQESKIRRMGVLQRCRTYEVKTRVAYPIRIVTPLSFWTTADIWEYFDNYNIPKNPTYQIHNLKRMGCASCPAYKGWEVEQAKDPTRISMLKRNLQLLLQYNQVDRYNEAIENLKQNHLMPELWGQKTLD